MFLWIGPAFYIIARIFFVIWMKCASAIFHLYVYRITSLSRSLFVLLMVFWTTYPLTKVIRSFWKTDLFQTDRIDKSPIPSPTGKTIEKAIDTEEIRSFLRTYFGDPPRTPILDLTFDPDDHVFLVRDQMDQIAGTIRYHFIGNLITSRSEPIYVVDAFCIHPTWRGKGVGDYLLTELNRYVNRNDIPYSVFLKEGSPLSIFHQPTYTGWYRYCELTEHKVSSFITDRSIQQAYQIMDIYRLMRPNVLLIRNEHTTNQIWKWYRKELDWILIGLQDTHQRIGQKKLGWITTWIESPMITEERRREAADAVADMLYPTFDFLWINERWIGNSMRWKRDGAFHWYTYQWSTNATTDVSYGMMM